MDPKEPPVPESAGADGKTTGAPVPAVTTSETTPIWARTVPVVEPLQTFSKPSLTPKDTAEELLPPDLSDLEPGQDPSVTAPEQELPGTVTKQEKVVESEPGEPSEPEAEPLPALPMQKTDPDWAHTEPPVGPVDETDPKRPITMQKPAPAWAQTVPAPPGETAEDLAPAQQDPSRESPGTPAEPKPAWSPAATASSAPPVKDSRADDEVWPPEPPTERAMPAWPPSSTISEEAESTDIPASTIPSASWADEFDSKPGTANTPPQPAAPAPDPKPKVAPAEPPPAAVPAASKPAAARVKAQAVPEQAPTVVPAASTPPTASPKPIAVPIAQAPTVVPEPPKPAPKPTPAPVAAEVKPATVPPPPPRVKTQPTAPEQAAADVWSEPASAATPAPAPAPTKAPDSIDWPSPVDVPAWAPQVHIGPTHPQYVPPAEQAPAPRTAPAPAPAAPPPPKATATPQPVPTARSAAANDPAKGSSGSWAVVDQKRKVDPSKLGPTPEDRSYAEWFAWAKRGGAPASACHAAAQGAFQALASGKDVAVAVQWATAAMARPPVPVTTARQTYCAWFSLANIDLNLDQHKAHLFASAAVQALDAGADASSAHATGLKAAGVA